LEGKWRWIIEWLTPEDAHLWHIKKIIFQGETEFQKVDIIETRFGKHLLLDGKTQSTEKDEYIYHEALVHPIMFTHPDPRKILILGGGEGATLREVLKHKTVTHITMVDIDKKLIELCQQYLYEWHRGSFQDPKVKLKFTDGRRFLEEEEDSQYDVIILDLTDPTRDSPSARLYTKEFYTLVFKTLKDDGMMVTQATSVRYTTDVFATLYKTIKTVFPIARAYGVFVPAFLSDWGFVIGSKKYDPLQIDRNVLKKRIEARLNGELKYYDEDLHYALFIFGKDIKEVLKKTHRVSTDNDPVYMPI